MNHTQLKNGGFIGLILYVTSEERKSNNLLNFIKDKVRKGLVLDADISLYESLNKLR